MITLTPIKDNTLYENVRGSNSSGAGSHIIAGATDKGDIRRALIAFDISEIPSGSTIKKVELSLFVSRTKAGRHEVALHRMEADWGEGASNADDNPGRGAPAEPGDATWNHRFFDFEEWFRLGGDFSRTASATSPVGGRGDYTWGSTPEMVADVQDWLDDPTTNFGWLLKGNEDDEQTTKRFNSRDNGDKTTRPVLTIEYQLPPQTIQIITP